MNEAMPYFKNMKKKKWKHFMQENGAGKTKKRRKITCSSVTTSPLVKYLFVSVNVHIFARMASNLREINILTSSSGVEKVVERKG